ncbi:aldo/keto reductase [Kocuria rhizophila]|nr:aldo/keto reductase [Kocuria rhizophila]
MSSNQTLQLNDGNTIRQSRLRRAAGGRGRGGGRGAPGPQDRLPPRIDTANTDGNEEEGVGRAIASSGIPARGALRATTRSCEAVTTRGLARATLEAMEQVLQRALAWTDVDLHLIHWSQPEKGKYLETWKAFPGDQGLRQGPVHRCSNFTEKALQDVLYTGERPPPPTNISEPPLSTSRPCASWVPSTASSPRRGSRWARAQGGPPGRDHRERPRRTAPPPPRWSSRGTWPSATWCSPKVVTPERIQENWDAQKLTLTPGRRSSRSTA